MLKDIADLHANISIHFETNKNNFNIEFMNRTISLCKLIHDRRYEPFMRIFYELMKQYSPEYINKCPIEKVFKHFIST